MTQIDFQFDKVGFKVSSVTRAITIDNDEVLDNCISFKFRDGIEIVYEINLSILDLMEALETGQIIGTIKSLGDISVIGKKFGKWVILELIKKGYKRINYCLVQCECGIQAEILLYNVIHSISSACKSCSLRQHGWSDTPTYKSWSYIKNDKFATCSRWNLFENFLEDMGERPKGYLLKKININGRYEPNNCVWYPNERKLRFKTNSIKEDENFRKEMEEISNKLFKKRYRCKL